MDPITSLYSAPKGWLLNSVLAPHVDAFVEKLRQGRYAANTNKRYVGCIAHFARWMSNCCLPVSLLDEDTVEQFLGNHLPRCACPAPVERAHGDLRAACGHLLEMLREQGAIAQPAPAAGPIADWPTSTGAMAGRRSSARSRAVRTSCLSRQPPAVRWRITCVTNGRPPPIRPSSFAISRRATYPSAGMPFGA